MATRKDDDDAYLPAKPKSVKEHSIDINLVTWNINKGACDDSSGFAEVRDHLMDRFYSTQSPLFSCLQEISKKKPSGITNYSCQSGGNPLKNAGTGHPDSTSDCQIKSTNPPPKGDKCNYNDVANERFYGSIICINDLHKFMLVSYHGKYSQMKEDKRRDEILKFFEKMCEVADIHKMTVIIGGDFNLDVGQWKAEVEEKFKGRVLVAVKYEKGPRRKHHGSLLDTFAVVYPKPDCPSTKCKLGNPTPASFENCSSTPVSSDGTSPVSSTGTGLQSPVSSTGTGLQSPVSSDGTGLQSIVAYDKKYEKRLVDLMDHDPVVITVSLYTKPKDC